MGNGKSRTAAPETITDSTKPKETKTFVPVEDFPVENVEDPNSTTAIIESAENFEFETNETGSKSKTRTNYDYKAYRNGEPYPSGRVIPLPDPSTIMFPKNIRIENGNLEDVEDHDHDDIVYGTNAYDRRKKMEQVETFEPVPNLQITRLVPIYQDHGGKETGRVRLELVESTTYGANPVAPPKSNYNRNRDIFDDRRLYNLV